MSRSKSSSNSNKKTKKLRKQAKGSWGSIKCKVGVTREYMMRALRYSYRDRKVRARNFRKLWITRIGIAVRNLGMTYSQFMNGLKKANIEINRKMLSELAIHDPKAFENIVNICKEKVAAA